MVRAETPLKMNPIMFLQFLDGTNIPEWLGSA